VEHLHIFKGSCVRCPPGLLDIKAIVDVSPGSGQLGIAALNLGVSYVGVCCDERHMSLLTNIADRDALRSIGE
jgi:predicted RNA methylase